MLDVWNKQVDKVNESLQRLSYSMIILESHVYSRKALVIYDALSDISPVKV